MRWDPRRGKKVRYLAKKWLTDSLLKVYFIGHTC